MLKKIHAIYAGLVFFLFFIILYIPTVLCLYSDRTKPIAHFFNKIVATCSYIFMPIWYKKEYRFKPNRKDLYVYCANHTSFADVPLLFATIPGFFNIIGKAVLATWPLFGYMYRHLYISVDRKSRKSGKDALDQANLSLEKGRSMVLFPEGTIPSKGAPNMIPFKDGAFRLAIEKQIPIVPVTIPYNWIILPDMGQKGFTFHKAKIIVHEPISTVGMTDNDIESLKEKTFNIIDKELKAHNK